MVVHRYVQYVVQAYVHPGYDMAKYWTLGSLGIIGPPARSLGDFGSFQVVQPRSSYVVNPGLPTRG